MVKAGRALSFFFAAAAIGVLFFFAPACRKKATPALDEAPSVSPSSSADDGEKTPVSVAPAWTPRAIAKVDMHTHIDPEIALPARRFLEGQGIGKAINLSGGWAGEGLEETLQMSKMTSGYYIIFANINFEGIGTPKWAAREVAQLERVKALGARGVKIAKNL